LIDDKKAEGMKRAILLRYEKKKKKQEQSYEKGLYVYA
jgi:hypothetical protein